ncbi:MAG: hypothetical protein WAN74_06800 [Thermoplasmata archaeon]
MPTKRIEHRSFRLVGLNPGEIALEFDGLAGLGNALQGFLGDWARSLVRPAGSSFRVFVQGRDFAGMASDWQVPVPLGTYLLLRIDEEHPFFCDIRAGWVLLQPGWDPLEPPTVVARIADGAIVNDPEATAPLMAVGP